MAKRSRSPSPSLSSTSDSQPPPPSVPDEPSPFPSQDELNLLPHSSFPRPIPPAYLSRLLLEYDLRDHLLPLELLGVLHRLAPNSSVHHVNERERYQAVSNLHGWLGSVASWRKKRGARKDGWRDPVGGGSVDAESRAREDLVTLWLSKIGPLWVSRLVSVSILRTSACIRVENMDYTPRYYSKYRR